MGNRRIDPIDIDCVRRQLTRAYRDTNLALAVLGDPRSALIRHGARAVFSYIPDDPAAARRAIPLAQFHRQGALRLEALEITLHGYYLEIPIGGTNQNAAAFSIRRPTPWRRALGLAPLLTLTLRATQGAIGATIGVARAPAPIDGADFIFTLDRDDQEELRRRYQAQVRPAALLRRLSAGLSRWWTCPSP